MLGAAAGRPSSVACTRPVCINAWEVQPGHPGNAGGGPTRASQSAQAAEMIAECNAAIERAGGVLKQAGRVSAERSSEGERIYRSCPKRRRIELLTRLEQTVNELDREAWVALVKATQAVCAPALGEGVVFDALMRFHRQVGRRDPGARTRSCCPRHPRRYAARQLRSAKPSAHHA